VILKISRNHPKMILTLVLDEGHAYQEKYQKIGPHAIR
jgi:hypothetical protein